jgi:hypothetical protein
MNRKSCFFIGHRETSSEVLPALRAAIEQQNIHKTASAPQKEGRRYFLFSPNNEPSLPQSAYADSSLAEGAKDSLLHLSTSKQPARTPSLHHPADPCIGCWQGGLSMKITHTHPSYANDQERLQRLQDTRKLCAAKVQAALTGQRAGG